jgi:hypothetical protein|tara:strand:- start:2406 stop:2726 length:321 start_codon:yes stop_codon:yes gene_type:complete
MANSSDNVKKVNRVAKDIEKLLERKADEYGSFTKTSYFFHGFLESLISAHNGKQIKVPKNIFGVCMMAIKIWRTITNPRYKKDSYDDTAGYNELNRIFDMELNDKK